MILDSNTVAESDMSLKFRSFLHRVNWSSAKDAGPNLKRCNTRQQQTFLNMGMFMSSLHCIASSFSGKGILRNFTFRQKRQGTISLWNWKDNTSKDPLFVMRNMEEFGIQIEWTMTGHSRTTTSRRKELCTWCCVCVVKCSWRMKPSCWTLRRPTPMTTWKPRSRESTRSTTWTRERARSCHSLRSQFCVVTLISCTSHNGSSSGCLRVCLIPSHGRHHACMSWAFSLTSLTCSSSSLSSSHSSLSSSSSFYP